MESAVVPIVEIEEDVYSFEPADNGAGPMWCHGSTCLVRIGDDVFASGLETIKDAKPLNNCRWMLFHRSRDRWKKICFDPSGRTREPCPLAGFCDGKLFLSANPTLSPDPNAYSGPARPEILQFAVENATSPARTLAPVWSGQPRFTEHSYRSFAADGDNRELILFQNVGYTHAEWAFLDRSGKWSARGRLKWPWGADYEKPQPIRVCYPNVAIKDRAVHFCGVSDIIEPNPKWRAFKREITGRNWDYDFRRLFYTWSPDITTETFRPWVEIASREKTCGWITPGDLWPAPDGNVHIMWSERALDERLREKFFPAEKQSHSLSYAVVRNSKIVLRRTLLTAEEGKSNERPGRGRFHVTADKRLFVFFYVHGTDASGQRVSENRLVEILPGGVVSKSARVPLNRPFTSFFTATIRAGTLPSNTLELLGTRDGSGKTISYARIRLDL
ncbi:MAG: hypothetical protein JSW59_15955 [Phycisphaerales bacterium]|nr:MAG: hypothetical protein JSW59_15955 [Phycisphaerales bacterium]